MSKLLFCAFVFMSGILKADLVCPKAKDVAPEILRALFEGLHIDKKYVSCLSQSNYKYFRVDEIRYPKPPPTCLFQEGDTYKIKSVKEVDHMRFHVEFDVKMAQPCNGKKVFTDKFEFVMNGKAAQKSERSCANLINPPENNIVRAPCAKLK